jgi:hypothetical protein
MSHKRYRTEKNCLNCGADVQGKFCQECGQENIETHENFFHLAGHTIGDFFHYDSKFFRSLIPLFTRPGFLTVEYWKGRRSHYIHPLRLFFFITIIMVITASAYYKKFEKAIKEEKIVRTEDTRPLTEEEKVKAARMEKRIRSTVDQSFDFLSVYLKYISFLLLPLYALGIKVLYRRQRKFYVDHLVYTFHLQSFVYIIISLVLLIPLFIDASARRWTNDVIILATVLYLIFSLKYAYRQSWVKTILKSVLATIYIIFITVTFVALIMVTLLQISKYS